MKTLLLGDFSPTKCSAPYFVKKDMDALFSDMLSLFVESDFSIVNLECALTESDGDIQKFGPALKAPLETAEVMKSAGIHYCGLSNNHIFDYGIKGYRDTVVALENAGITYTGFGENYEDSRKNLIVKKDGETICVIAVCEHEYSYALENRMGSRPFDPIDTLADIRNAKKEADRVIVMYHGGKEQCFYPSPRLLKVCRAMVDNGADVVLCQHSHCIGCYENYNDGHILYGQGNFHFADIEKGLAGWNTSLAVKYDTTTNEMSFVPLASTETGVRLANEAEQKEILKGFEKRSEELKTGEWKAGWRAFCEEKREIYTSAITNAYTENSRPIDNEFFNHYLDCEAHSDVWRELFPTWNKTNEL